MVAVILDIYLLQNSMRYFVMAGLLLAAGCGPTPPRPVGSRSAGEAVLVSRAQAESIARVEAAKRIRGRFAIGEASLREERSWRVVVEYQDSNQTTCFTNIVPASLSRTNAEMLTLGLARELSRSGPSQVVISELLQGYYWHVGVDVFPAAPGNHFILVISATDGSVLRSIPGA